MKSDFDVQLQRERDKLDQMVDNAFNKGIAMCQCDDIQRQGRRIEQLIALREQTKKIIEANKQD